MINLSLEKTTGSNLATWEQPFYLSFSFLTVSLSPIAIRMPLHSHLSSLVFSSDSRSLRTWRLRKCIHAHVFYSQLFRSFSAGSARAAITGDARQGYFCRMDSFWKYLKLGRFVVCARVELDKAPVFIASHPTDLGSGARLKDSRGSAIDAGARIVEKVMRRKRG